MKSVSVALALGVVILGGIPSSAQFRAPRGRDPQAASYGWLSSLEEGKTLARKTGKPLLVVLRCVP
jgi:hypothetical protein